MWKNSEIESGLGSEPATSKGAAYWLSRPKQMVLTAAGATSTMGIVLGLAIWLGFVDMLPAAIVDVSSCSHSADALCGHVSIYSLSIA